MKCQKCGSPELQEWKSSIPVKLQRGSLTILDVPTVKCMKCGNEIMLTMTSSRLRDIVSRWQEIGLPGDQTVRYK